jgi:HlyD family secretion protein
VARRWTEIPCPRGRGHATQPFSWIYRCYSRALATFVVLALVLAGCGRGERGEKAANNASNGSGTEGKTAGSHVEQPERRNIHMNVLQPGTIQAFEVTPIYARIAGYVGNYRYNIGDRVKAGEILLDMRIPDYDEQLGQKTASVKRTEVQIRVAQSSLRAADARLETAKAHVVSANAGVKRAQASVTRWESEYKRLQTLVDQRVLDVQVRDETFRQFEEASAAYDQSQAAVSEATSSLDQATADRDKARVDIEAVRADLEVARSEERFAKVNVEYGHIRAPYDGVITQRNVSPGDYLQPGGGTNGRPLFVFEQTDPVRVFVGVPELASAFISDGDTATIRIQAIPGSTREGKLVRSGFSLNPSTRTLQAEIDIANADGHLRPGWYVTVGIAINRENVWTLPSNAIALQGGQNYYFYLQVDGKPVRTSVLIGPSDDLYTEVLRRRVPGSKADEWVPFDGSERVYVGGLDALADGQSALAKPKGEAR